MAASPSKQQIARKLRELKRKYPDTEFHVLRASNGEVAIIPVQPIVDALQDK